MIFSSSIRFDFLGWSWPWVLRKELRRTLTYASLFLIYGFDYWELFGSGFAMVDVEFLLTGKEMFGFLWLIRVTTSEGYGLLVDWNGKIMKLDYSSI